MNEDFSQSLDRLKESFLFAAAQGGNIQDCDALIEIGADINWIGPGGDTPLLSACRRGHVETVALLLARGADPNTAGTDSMAPLHVATRRGDHALLSVLMDSNVDQTMKTRDGLSAMEIARSKGYDDIYALLAQRMSGSGEFEVIQPQRQGGSNRNGGTRNNERNSNEDSRRRNGNSGRPSTTGAPVTSSDSNKSRVLGSLPSIVSPRMVVETGMAVDDYRGASQGHGAVSIPRVTSPRANIDNATNRRNGNNGNNGVLLSTTGVVSPTVVSLNSTTVNPSPIQGSNVVQSSSLPPAKYSLINSRSSDNGGGVISSANSKLAAAAAVASLDETSIALQTLLGQEQRERKVLEGKVNSLKEQVVYLTSELQITKSELDAKLSEREQLVGALDLLRGSASALATLTVTQCEQLEVQLRSSLDAIENRKATLIQNELEMQKEQRLCIVCQERDKCVVLLPCRHMCLCEDCSTHQLLDHCPLCRRPIAHKISVFS